MDCYSELQPGTKSSLPLLERARRPAWPKARLGNNTPVGGMETKYTRLVSALC
jgi:hypothetical protein